jgi:selenocysteine lyase/cysteine desulfurase
VDEQLFQWREDTPGVAGRVHLNNAGAGLMPKYVLGAITNHLQREFLLGGYEAEAEVAESIRKVYASVAGLLGSADLGAIVTVEILGWHASDAVNQLRARGINTSAAVRDDAMIDMDQKRATSALRISPHYYNTEAEIDVVCEAVRSLVRSPPRTGLALLQ